MGDKRQRERKTARPERAKRAQRRRRGLEPARLGTRPTAAREDAQQGNGDQAGGADAFAHVLAALDRVTAATKTATFIDLIRRSADKKIVFTVWHGGSAPRLTSCFRETPWWPLGRGADVAPLADPPT